MKKLNQKGFGIVEIMLVILLAGLVGGIGYYVFTQAKNNDETNTPSSDSSVKIEKKSEPEPVAKDETADWLLYEASDGTFKIKLADGWKMLKSSGSTGLLNFDNELSIKPGTKATIAPVEGGRDGGIWLAINYAKTGSDAYAEIRGEKVATTKTKSGLRVDHYHFTQTKTPEGPGLMKGDQSYTYSTSNANGQLVVYYGFTAKQTDHHNEIEKILSSIQLK